MIEVRDYQGLVDILEKAMATEDYGDHNHHIACGPEASYDGWKITAGSGSMTYDVRFNPEDLYDGLEKFFDARLKARIHAMMEKMVDHEKRYIEHLFGPDAAA